MLFSVAAVMSASLQLQVQQLAGLAVRVLSQGEAEGGVRHTLIGIEPLAEFETDFSDGVLCAHISKRPQGALKLLGYEPQARACTWVGKYFEPS